MYPRWEKHTCIHACAYMSPRWGKHTCIRADQRSPLITHTHTGTYCTHTHRHTHTHTGTQTHIHTAHTCAHTHTHTHTQAVSGTDTNIVPHIYRCIHSHPIFVLITSCSCIYTHTYRRIHSHDAYIPPSYCSPHVHVYTHTHIHTHTGAYTPVNPNIVSPRYTMPGRPGTSSSNTTPGPLDYMPEKPRITRATYLHPRTKTAPESYVYNPGIWSSFCVCTSRSLTLLMHVCVCVYITTIYHRVPGHLHTVSHHEASIVQAGKAAQAQVHTTQKTTR
jgi:hypothetical protein